MISNSSPSLLPGLTLKAWVKYRVSLSVLTLISSFNVSSMARTSPGTYTITLTNALNGVDYVFAYYFDATGLLAVGSPTAKSTTVPQVAIFNSAGSSVDVINGYIAFYE
jgi:hypothetical protein